MKKNRPKTRLVSDPGEGTMRTLVLLTATAALALTLGAGNAFAYDEEVVIVKCQEKVSLGEGEGPRGGQGQKDVPPQVYQFQASDGVMQPVSCVPLPNASPFVDGGRSCAQCLSDLISDEGCGLQGSPVVVLAADPDRVDFKSRSVEKYTLVCDLDDDDDSDDSDDD